MDHAIHLDSNRGSAPTAYQFLEPRMNAANRLHRSVFILALVAAAGGQSFQARACDLERAATLSHPSALPVGSTFGMRLHPLLGIEQMHTGIDYSGPMGDPVIAAAAGRVVIAAQDGMRGVHIVIDHGGRLRTSYSHMLPQLTVREGDCVAAGQQVGRIGNTGLSGGPHLHFEVLRDEQPVDPLTVLPVR